ncbi:hypothetical protein D3C74_488550 [compost metagenome]
MNIQLIHRKSGPSTIVPTGRGADILRFTVPNDLGVLPSYNIRSGGDEGGVGS